MSLKFISRDSLKLVLASTLIVTAGVGCSKGGGGGSQPAAVNQPISAGPGQPIINNNIPHRGGGLGTPLPQGQPPGTHPPSTQPPVVRQPSPDQPPVVVAIPEDQRISAAKEILRRVDVGVPAYNELMGQNQYGEPLMIRPLSMAALSRYRGVDGVAIDLDEASRRYFILINLGRTRSSGPMTVYEIAHLLAYSSKWIIDQFAYDRYVVAQAPALDAKMSFVIESLAQGRSEAIAGIEQRDLDTALSIVVCMQRRAVERMYSLARAGVPTRNTQISRVNPDVYVDSFITQKLGYTMSTGYARVAAACVRTERQDFETFVQLAFTNQDLFKDRVFVPVQGHVTPIGSTIDPHTPPDLRLPGETGTPGRSVPSRGHCTQEEPCTQNPPKAGTPPKPQPGKCTQEDPCPQNPPKPVTPPKPQPGKCTQEDPCPQNPPKAGTPPKPQPGKCTQEDPCPQNPPKPVTPPKPQPAKCTQEDPCPQGNPSTRYLGGDANIQVEQPRP